MRQDARPPRFTTVSIMLLMILLMASLAAVSYLGGNEISDDTSSHPRQGNDWPCFKTDPQRTSNISEDGPVQPRIAWVYEMPDEIWSSPAIADGKMYVGVNEFSIICLDMDTGDLIWENQTDGGVYSSPCISNGRLYIGSNDKGIYCYDANTGQQMWKTTVGDLVMSSPVVVDGMVYVGSHDSNLYCLFANNGTIKWASPTDGRIYASAAVDSDNAYVDSSDGFTYAFNLTDGQEQWRFDMTGEFEYYSTPAVMDGKVFVASATGHMYCIDTQSGNEIWSTSIGAATSSAAIAYGRVFVGTDRGLVHCLDASTGDNIWNITSTVTGDPSSVLTTPAVANDRVYMGWGKDIVCLNRNTGDLIWNHTTGKFGAWGMCSSPCIANGSLYIGAPDYKIYCFRDQGETTPPRVISTSPSTGATDVSVSTGIAVTFDEAMNPSTFYDETFYLSNSTGAHVKGQISYDPNTNTATFTPDHPLKVNTTYYPTVSALARDLGSNGLDGDGDTLIEGSPSDDHTWSFTTEVPISFPPGPWRKVPPQFTVEDTPITIDFTPYITLVDDRYDLITLSTNSSYGHVNGLNITFTYPDGISDEWVMINATNFLGTSGTEFVMIISPVNDPPMISGVPNLLVTENIPYILNVTPFISDEESSLDDLTIKTNSSYADVSGREITFLYPHGIPKEWVNISISDGSGSGHQEIQVIVKQLNVPPTITGIPKLKAVEDVPLMIDLSLYIHDDETPLGDLVIIADTPYGNLTGNILNLSYPEGVTRDTVNISVSDGVNTTASHFNVTIKPVADPPVITPIPDQVVTEDLKLSLDLSAYISDVDTSFESLRISTGLPQVYREGTSLILDFSSEAPVTLVNLTVSDGTTTIYMEFTVTVRPVNDRPSLYNGFVSPQSGNEGTRFYFRVNYRDSDGSDDPIVQLRLDGEDHDLKRVTGELSTGAVYQISMNLDAGIHSYSFHCSDREDSGENSTSILSFAVSSGGKVTDVGPGDDDSSMGWNPVALVLILISLETLLFLLFVYNYKKGMKRGGHDVGGWRWYPKDTALKSHIKREKSTKRTKLKKAPMAGEPEKVTPIPKGDLVKALAPKKVKKMPRPKKAAAPGPKKEVVKAPAPDSLLVARPPEEMPKKTGKAIRYPKGMKPPEEGLVDAPKKAFRYPKGYRPEPEATLEEPKEPEEPEGPSGLEAARELFTPEDGDLFEMSPQAEDELAFDEEKGGKSGMPEPEEEKEEELPEEEKDEEAPKEGKAQGDDDIITDDEIDDLFGDDDL